MALRDTTVDTVGESFELNVAAAQEAGTLIKTAKPIILAQGSVREKWNYSYFRTTHAGSISQLAQLQFASNDSPTVSLLGLGHGVQELIKHIELERRSLTPRPRWAKPWAAGRRNVRIVFAGSFFPSVP
jgi:hypothetical protein